MSHKFFVRNLILNNFYLKHFCNIIVIFCSVKPKSEFTFPFQYIKHGCSKSNEKTVLQVEKIIYSAKFTQPFLK